MITEHFTWARNWIKDILELQDSNRKSYVRHYNKHALTGFDPHTCSVCPLFIELGNEYNSLLKSEQEALNKLRGGYNA